MPKNQIGLRKDGSIKAVSTAPSINKTPVGNTIVPLPYPTLQDLSNSVGVVPTVKFNGDPVYVLNQSSQPMCKGDDPGTVLGIKSSTVNGPVKPVNASSSVRVGGNFVVRANDTNTMNGGNNPGMYVMAPSPSMGAANSAGENGDPPPKAEQKSWLAKGAQFYQDKISIPAHNIAGDAMDVGGKTALAGGVTMMAGAPVAATGIGVPLAAGMEAVGGAAATAGGIVSTAGSVTEMTATGLDKASEFVLTGKVPNLAAAATNLATTLVLNKIGKFIPGLKGAASSAVNAAEKSESKVVANALQKEAKALEGNVKAEANVVSNAAKPKPAGNGVGIKGSGGKDGKDPCAKYKKGDAGNGGDFRGGSYGGTREPGIESHHMPADSITDIRRSQGPAIQMTEDDHAATSSFGSSNAAKDYRAAVKSLIDGDKFRDAMAKEIKDVRRVAREAGDPTKYNKAIQEMLQYAKCRELLLKK